VPKHPCPYWGLLLGRRPELRAVPVGFPEDGGVFGRGRRSPV